MYGGLLSILNTLLLARSVNAAGKAASGARTDKKRLSAGKSVVIRFTLVLVSFYIGIVYLKLVALEILTAFALAQLGTFSISLRVFIELKKEK